MIGTLGRDRAHERNAAPTNRGHVWLHVAGAAVALVIASFFVGHDAYVFLDEAALLAQVEVVQDGGWTVERPFAALDPSGHLAPMARSTLAGERFAPFPNHPLHVGLVAAADGLGGRSAVGLLSALGVAGAAAAAGFLASAAGRVEAAVAVWATALFSPLSFDANLVVGHGIAAAATGMLFVLVIRLSPRAHRPPAVLAAGIGAGLLAAAASLLRSEAVLLAVCVAIVAGGYGLRRRRWSVVAGGAGAAAGALLAYVLEPRWIQALVGTSPGTKTIAASSRGGIEGALDGAWRVLVEAGNPVPVALVGAVSLAVAATALVLAGTASARLSAAMAASAAILAAVNLADPTIIPGILWAFPLLPVVATATRALRLLPTSLRVAMYTAALFALAVLATQYRIGGGVEWGWRYFAIALPAVCAGLAVALVASVRALQHPAAKLTMAGVLAACLLVPFSGLVAQRRVMDRTHHLIGALERALEDADAQLVLAADSSFGRYAWQRSVAGDVVTVGSDGSGLRRLQGSLPDAAMLLVFVGSPPPLEGSGLEPAGRQVVLLPGSYAALPVRPA